MRHPLYERIYNVSFTNILHRLLKTVNREANALTGKVINLSGVTYIIDGKRELITPKALKKLKAKLALRGKLIGEYA